jgi:thermostable 8-oxoguanine DNA glycosylase
LIDIHKNGIKGMGWSTFSKFLYFLQLKIGDNRALIFDRRVINALKRFEDDEIKDIQGVNYPPRTKDYFAYLQAMNRLAAKMGIEPDKIEMFLYQFGANLSEPK